MRDFGPSNEPGTCPWCGRKLSTTRPWKNYPPFDTLDCARQFAINAYLNGFRFKSVTPPKDPHHPKEPV